MKTRQAVEMECVPFMKGDRDSKLDPEMRGIRKVKSENENDDPEFGIRVDASSTTRSSNCKGVHPLLNKCVIVVSFVLVFAILFNHICIYLTNHSVLLPSLWAVQRGEDEEEQKIETDDAYEQVVKSISEKDKGRIFNVTNNDEGEDDEDGADHMNDDKNGEKIDDKKEVEEKELSLEERKKFLQDPYDHNLGALQTPKLTPSGWWPDDLWIHDCVNKKRHLVPFLNPPEWNDYRLGDCVKICGGCPKDDYHPELAHEATMAGQYYDLGCDKAGPQWHVKRGNVTLLNQIIEGMHVREGFEIPDPGKIIIHLRLGDKIEDSKASVFDMLQNSADPGHKSFHGLHAIKSLYEFMSNVVTSAATKVEIRGGSQHPDMYKKSKTYAYCLKEAFEEAGYNTTMNLEEGNADIDFYYMVNAHKIITTVGGFSRFIGHLVLERGGTAYGRVF